MASYGFSQGSNGNRYMDNNLNAQLKMKKRKGDQKDKRSTYELQDLSATNEQQMLLNNVDDTL